MVMTPFGEKLRSMRLERGISQKEMAANLGLSSAYLSALEHGHRGRPTWALVQQIIGYFNVIWDEAEELQLAATQSHPRVVVDTSGLDPKATMLANLLSDKIQYMNNEQLSKITDLIKGSEKP